MSLWFLIILYAFRRLKPLEFLVEVETVIFPDVGIGYHNDLSVRDSEAVVHGVDAGVVEAVRVPREVLVVPRDVDVQPHHVQWQVIEVEPEVHVRHVPCREVGPTALMVA